MNIKDGVKRVPLDYEPQPYQLEIHQDKHRYRVVIIGRQGGKTELSLNELITKSGQKPGLYWYVAPYRSQAKDIAWRRLKMLLRVDPIWKFNEVELSAENEELEVRIELKGTDNEDSLRGVGLAGLVMDEVAMIKEHVWPEILRPMLLAKMGWVLMIGTPKGRNWLYELYLKGLDNEEPEWKSWQYDTNVNKCLPAGEFESMRRDMSRRVFNQEALAQFLDDETSVFKGVKKCAVATLREPEEGRFYVMGVDLAKHEDWTVLTVIDAKKREVVAFQRFQDIKWPEQKNKIQYLANKYNKALIWLDASGVGDPIFDDLQASYLSVEGYKFTNQSKAKLINQLALSIEQRLVTYPNEDVLIQELLQFEYELRGGTIFYSAPKNKHDDCVISLALAVWGIRSHIQSAQMVERRIDEEYPRDRQGHGIPVISKIPSKTWGY